MKKYLLFPLLFITSISYSFSMKDAFGSSCMRLGITAATFYGVCYGINWVATTLNRPVSVQLKNFSNKGGDQETTLFVHGIAETHKQALWYTSKQEPSAHLIDGDLYTYDFPDATKRFWRVNFTRTAFGQEYEVEGLQRAYEQVMTKQPEKKVILMGMSRGAATILNFVAKYQPKNIKALVVESPFDSTISIVKNMLQRCYLDKVPGMQTLGHYIMSAIFWQHSPNGMQSIDLIEKIDKKIPILFVCSREDKVVPLQSTIDLYQKLKESGHEKVHIFIAQSGKHGKILHSDDGNNYEKVTNAFYKKYGLSYNKKLADEGSTLLDKMSNEY